MANCLLALTGQISIPGDSCGCPPGAGTSSNKTQGLSFACGNKVFGAVKSTDCSVQVTTAGAVGAAFVELPVSSGFSAIELLFVDSGSSTIQLRIGAAGATLAGIGGTFPTGFSGGEAFSFDIDAVTVAGTFTVAAQTAANCVTELNQAAVAAGFTIMPFSVAASGQIQVDGQLTGAQGSIIVNTANATIGFAVAALTVFGAGEDINVSGVFLNQFPATPALTRVQVSGSAQISVLVAGQAA